MPETIGQHQRVPRTLDEWISCGRLLLAPVLWIPALLGKPRLVAAGIVLSAASDIADGAVCHWRGARSDYSRQLDAIADSVAMLSTLGWLAVARPGSLRPLRGTLVAIAMIGTVLLIGQWRRYRMFGALHLDSARAAAVAGHVYVLRLLWLDSASRFLLRFFQLLATGAILESAWVIFGPHEPADRTPRPLLQWLFRAIRA